VSFNNFYYFYFYIFIVLANCFDFGSNFA